MNPNKPEFQELLEDLDESGPINEEEWDEEFLERSDDNFLLGGCRGRHCYTTIDKL